jgi:hypothetical protein
MERVPSNTISALAGTEVIGVTLDQLQRLSSYGTDIACLSHTVRDRHAGYHDGRWRNTEAKCPGDIPTFLLPYLVDLPDVLRLDNQASQVVLIVDHGACNGPVRPLVIWIEACLQKDDRKE